ncbi:MAG: phage portal protein [Chloroflexi bacterium]|nr:phage portal protein [Chloroflexota bacterium]
MFLSGGTFTKSPDRTLWSGSLSNWGQVALAGRWFSYAQLYKAQPWVRTVVDKLANAQARLPLKVYTNTGGSREPARDTPYGRLLRRPNNLHHPYLLRAWTQSTIEIYGEAFWGKVRDAGGRPVELVPMHPTNVHDEVDDNGRTVWSWDNGRRRIENIHRRDLVHFRLFNPDGLNRGLSRLESLRSTLENEEGARRANSAMWRNGGRPGTILRHPRTLSDDATKRIAAQWADLHGGVDNWAKAAVLEEGMEATILPLNVEELQYIEARKLNREEVCGVFDVPPPVVHILDRATFSNITEQMRSMYRDTMAPRLSDVESTLEFELRDGSFDQDVGPDFPDGVYAEFLMDEVLRGDFEVRVNSWATAIQTGQATPAEARQAENRPFIEGTDRLLINAALVPIAETDASMTAETEPLDGPTLRTVMGRLSRQKTLADVDPAALTAGLNGSTGTVLAELESAKAAGLSLESFRQRVKSLASGTPEPTELHVHPVVNVSIEPPAVTVNTPDVTVNTPDVVVNTSTSKTVVRDGDGRISQVIEEPSCR